MSNWEKVCNTSGRSKTLGVNFSGARCLALLLLTCSANIGELHQLQVRQPNGDVRYLTKLAYDTVSTSFSLDLATGTSDGMR